MQCAVGHFCKPSSPANVEVLRSVLPKGVGDGALEALLLRCGGDVSAAANTFFDGGTSALMSPRQTTPRCKAMPADSGGDSLDRFARAEARDSAGQKAPPALVVGVPVLDGCDTARLSRPQTPREAVPMSLPPDGRVPMGLPVDLDVELSHRWPHMPAASAMDGQIAEEMAELRARVARAEAQAAAAVERAALQAEAREAEVREATWRWAAEQEDRRAEAERQTRLACTEARAAAVRAAPALVRGPPSGKWVGIGHNSQNGFRYRITFYLTLGEDGQVTGVAVPPNAFQGFGRTRLVGVLDRADNTCRLDHAQQSGWTKCRFRRRGHDTWTLHCEWNMANMLGWHGTHELTFSGDTRTTPGGFSLF